MQNNKFQKEELVKLGLVGKETEIYWELLHSGAETVYQLAKKLGIPRSTMYGLANSLVQKGLADWTTQKSGKQKLALANTDSLGRKLKQEQAKVDELGDTIASLALYQKLLGNKKLATVVKYYEGNSGLEQIVWNTLSAKGDMYGYSAWDRNRFLSAKFNELHQKEAMLRGPHDHVIVNDERLSEILPYIHNYPLEVRSIPKEQLYISGDIYIYDDIYAMSLFEGEKIVGIEIQNAEFVKVQKSIFENLWKSATKHV